MMQMFLIPQTSQIPTPEHSPPQPHLDDPGPKGQCQSFADQVDYLSDHPSEAEKTENESENLDTSSAECTVAAPPQKRKKLVSILGCALNSQSIQDYSSALPSSSPLLTWAP